MIKLHLGCGTVAPSGWVNLDGSTNARLSGHPILRWLLFKAGIMSRQQYEAKYPKNIKYCNLCQPLPFRDNSVDAIASCHFLEHLSKTEAERLMRECYRVLKPGGVCRVAVPDLSILVNSYIDQHSQADDDKKRNAATERFLLGFYDEVHHPRASHKWLYDGVLLKELFGKSGFNEVGVKDFQNSRIEAIAEVESREDSLQVEGVK